MLVSSRGVLDGLCWEEGAEIMIGIRDLCEGSGVCVASGEAPCRFDWRYCKGERLFSVSLFVDIWRVVLGFGPKSLRVLLKPVSCLFIRGRFS